jgi:hypothetical protein
MLPVILFGEFLLPASDDLRRKKTGAERFSVRPFAKPSDSSAEW